MNNVLALQTLGTDLDSALIDCISTVSCYSFFSTVSQLRPSDNIAG